MISIGKRAKSKTLKCIWLIAMVNGAKPIYMGQLKKQEMKQRVEFPAKAGRLFRLPHSQFA